MSKSLTTKNIASVLVGIGLVFAMTFAFATPAKAVTIDELQAQITALLAQITALQGGTTTSGASCSTFTRNHSQGDSGGEVLAIQQFLNANGAQVAASGAGSPGNETSYFGSLTKAAVIKFQNMYAADILAPVGLSAGTGYWGPSSRSKANTMCAGTVPGVPGVPVTGNGLKVALASDSPVNVALVAGQAIGELGKFTFSNPTGAAVTVTSVGFQRIGVSADSTLSSVYLYQGAERITESAGVSSGKFTFNNSAGVFTVPAGGSVSISVRANIAASTSGEQIGVQLNSVASSGALDTSVSLPIAGGIQTISSATIATVVVTYTGPSGATDNPASEVRVFEGSTVVSTHAVNLTALTLEQRGTSKDGDIINYKLYIDGTQVGTTMDTTINDRVTFDLSGSPIRLETGTRIIKALADIVGGSSFTYNVQIRRAADMNVVDAQLGQPVLITGTLAAGSANTIAGGSLSIAKSADSPTTNVAVASTNVLWARFEFRAAGEDVKIEALTLTADYGGATATTTDNAKVFVNGSQIGSTLDIASGGTEFTFGSSFIARQGQTEIVEIYGDAKTALAANYPAGASMDFGVTLAAADTEGMNSGNTVSAVSEVEGNARVIAASSLTASKASGYGDQTLIAGTNNAKLGSFALSAGSTEGINVNSIVINLSSNESASITDLRLVDNSTGTQIGSTKVAPSTANTFSVNIALPVSGTKIIDLVGNIKSGSNAGPWIADIDTTTTGTGAVTAQSASVAADVSLQTITVGSGTLTQAVGVSPDNANVIAGASDVKIGSFNFTAANSSFTIQDLKVKIPANSASSVAIVTLKYKDAAGVAQSRQASLTVTSAQTNATATFTGLGFAIPTNTTRAVDVYVDVPTLSSSGASGRAITAILDWNEGYTAIDSAGTASTTMGAYADLGSDDTSGKGTMYVRASVPTVAAGTAPPSVLSAGSNQVLGRFSITADAAGQIDWGSVVITLNKTAAVTTGATTTVAIWSGANNIAGTLATTSGSLIGALDACENQTTCLIHFRPTAVETIPAGTTKTYELRATVGGLAAGSSVSASIANPQTSASSTAVFSSAAGTIGVSTVASLAWSDWSDLSDHSSSATGASTSDWTGDYLIKTLPLTIGTRSVAF